jgi:hypothetical protein
MANATHPPVANVTHLPCEGRPEAVGHRAYPHGVKRTVITSPSATT